MNHRCVCGKEFDNRISCSRHKSTCSVYRAAAVSKNKSFEDEGRDHVTCRYCGYKARDITKHLSTVDVPHPNRQEYRRMFPDQKLVCSDVEAARKRTNKALHGNENYRNRDAQRTGVLRALRDTDMMERVRRTKKARYGNSGYVNVEKRKKTLMERYGVDNIMKSPEVARRSVETRKVLYSDNPVTRKPLVSREELVRRHHIEGHSLEEIAADYSVTSEAISYWMKKFGLEVYRRVVMPRQKEYVRPADTVKEYFEACSSVGEVLSFCDFGRSAGNKKKSRLKRLFNTGRPFHHLKDRLKDVALEPAEWDKFLKEMATIKSCGARIPDID